VIYLSDLNRVSWAVSVFAEQGVSIRKLGYLECSGRRAQEMRPWPWYYESPLFSAFQKATGLEELQIEVGDERIHGGPMSFQGCTQGEIEGWGAPGPLLHSSHGMESLVNATFE
jgi:hypothetical protein